MNVRVDLQETIRDGMEVVFKAPCDYAEVTGLNVYYPVDGVVESQTFAFADAHANDLAELEVLFAKDAVVKVILDLSTNMAFVQNADTNAYLEKRIDGVDLKLPQTLTEEQKAQVRENIGADSEVAQQYNQAFLAAQKKAEDAADRAEAAKEALEGNLVLKKGGGLNSIVQALELDEEDIQKGKAPQANAECSTVFGEYGVVHADNDEAGNGETSMAVNYQNQIYGSRSFAANVYNKVFGKRSAAFGNGNWIGQGPTVDYPDYENIIPSAATVFGTNNHVLGDNAVGTGNLTHANGKNSMTGGLETVSEGEQSVALGQKSKAYGVNSMAGGRSSQTGEADKVGGSAGKESFAWGYNAQAKGICSVAFGANTQSTGAYALSGGHGTVSSNDYTFGYGKFLQVNKALQVAFGQYNEPTSGALFMVGNGTADDELSNAFEVFDDGISVGGEFLDARAIPYIEKMIPTLTPTAYVGKHVETTTIFKLSGFEAISVYSFCTIMLQSREGECVLLSLSQNYPELQCVRLFKKLGRIQKIYFNTAQNALYIQLSPWGIGLGARTLASSANNYDLTLEEVASVPSGCTELTINEYSVDGHSHDERYYTEAEVDTKFGNYYTATQVDTKFANVNSGGSAGMVREFQATVEGMTIGATSWNYSGTSSKFYTITLQKSLSGTRYYYPLTIDYKVLTSLDTRVPFVVSTIDGEFIKVEAYKNTGGINFEITTSGAGFTEICGYY